MALHSDLPDGQAQVLALLVGSQASFNEFTECHMSFFTAIAAFKGAFLGTLLGNQLPGKGYESAAPQRPGYGKPCHHHPHPNQFGYSHPQPGRPGQHKPYPSVGDEQPLPNRPLYPLFSLNR